VVVDGNGAEVVIVNRSVRNVSRSPVGHSDDQGAMAGCLEADLDGEQV
jgi:hypothetical protein